MPDADDRLLDASRRTLLKGVGIGALGAAGVGAAWSTAPGLLGSGGHGDQEDVLGLVSPGNATHVATGGRWAAADTWEGGTVPDEDARVHVPEDVTVTLDTEEDARLWTVRVDGHLRVDPAQDARLALDTLVVTGTGTLELGTDATPVAPDATVEMLFTDRGEIDESWDHARVSRGLLATQGATVSIHGAAKTSWDALETAPTAGTRDLSLPTAPTGWQVGDTLLVPGLHPEENQDEEVTLASVDGQTVTIEDPLEYDHVPPREDLDAYVANLDRNVRFRSPTQVPARRGHVMFMSTDVTVANAGFYELGRTEKARPFTDPANGVPPQDVPPNPQARYACHFHRTGVDRAESAREVRGSVVWGSPGWGFVNHASHVDFVDNVSYEVFGAGFVAEIGTEVGSFVANMAIRGQGSGGLPDSRQFHEGSEGRIDDFGHGGHGFWFQGPGVAVEDNVAGGHRHFGYVYWTRAKPDRSVDPDRLGGVVGEIPTFPIENAPNQSELRDIDEFADGMVPASYVTLRSFANNTVFASGGGLDISRHRFGAKTDEGAPRSVVAGFTAYNIGPHGTSWDDVRPPNVGGGQGGNNGISIRYSKLVDIEDVTLVSGAGDSRGIGINHNHAPVDVAVEGADLEGWTVGIRTFPHGEAPIRDATLDNDVDVQLTAGSTDSRWAPLRVELDAVEFGDGGRADVFAGVDLHDDLYGLFSPESETLLNGKRLYHAAQRPDFVPIPTGEDVAEIRGDSLGDLTGATPRSLVGKTNAELWSQFGIAVDGEMRPDAASPDSRLVGGYVTDGDGGDARTGPIDHVIFADGSLFEVGRLGQGKRLYVYDDPHFLAVPGRYAGLPYVRPEREAAGGKGRSFCRLELAQPATVYVAYDAEATASWLQPWVDTGDTVGTTANARRVYSREVDGPSVALGPCENSHRMYTVFVREA